MTQEDALGLASDNRAVLRSCMVVFALGKLAVYRLKSALARLHYDSDRAAMMLGWRPRVGVREGIKRVQPAP